MNQVQIDCNKPLIGVDLKYIDLSELLNSVLPHYSTLFYWCCNVKMTFKKVLFIMLLLTGIQVQAQFTVKYELQQIHNNYLHMGNIMLSINYDMFASDVETTILETHKAMVYKNDNSQLLDFMGVQTWYTQDYTIIIMPDEKKIVLGGPVAQLNSTSFAGINLDSLFVLYNLTQKIVNEQVIYQLAIPPQSNTPYQSMDIVVGDNGLYQKIILHSRYPLSYYQKCNECEDSFPRVEITFNYIEKDFNMPDINPILASIVKENNQYYLRGQYSNYRLVNVQYNN